MVEVIQWVITYVMIGALVHLGLQSMMGWLETPKLELRESVGTMLLWPIAVLVFVWFFVKGLLENREK